MAYCNVCATQHPSDIINEQDNDTKLSDQFVEIMAGKRCKPSVVKQLRMVVNCPTEDCEGELTVNVNAMVEVTLDENGHFEQIDEAQWEIY